MQNNVPITRLGKFFGDNDFNLEIEMGQEWLVGDMNFTCVLYKVDKTKTKTDDVYGEVSSMRSFKLQLRKTKMLGLLKTHRLNLGILRFRFT
jgi:hypothetical protein